MQLSARPTRCALRSAQRAQRRAATASAAASYKEAPSAAPADRRDRAKAALLGALLADAATMPLHWHYDIGQIRRKVLREPDGPLQAMLGLAFPDSTPLDARALAALQPEFFDKPSNLFYTYPLGELSPYGFEAAVLLRSLAKEGALLPERYAADSAAEYAAYAARPGARLNSLCASYVKQWEAGARWPDCGVPGDTQAHSLVRVPVVVARLAGSAALRDAVADAVRVHQAATGATDYAQAFAALLERVVLGASVSDALKWGAWEGANPLYDEQRKEASNAMAELGVDPRKVVAKYGISCALPGPFTGPLALVFNAGGGFEEAVRANIMAGGDSCSRAAVVGSLCGAQGGMAALPAAWTEKVAGWAEMEAQAEAVVAAAGYA